MTKRDRPFYGWKLIAVFWVIVLINASLPMFGLGMLTAFMAQDGHLGRTVAGSAYSVFIFANGLPAPLAAMMVNRWGIKVTAVTGNCLLGLAALAAGLLPPSPFTLLFVVGGLIGFASAIGGIFPAVVGMTFWFRQRRALAIAIVMSGLNIGGALCPPLLGWAIGVAHGDWRVGWWLIAACAVVAVLLALLFVVDAPERVGQRPLGAELAEDQSGTSKRRVHFTTYDWSPGEVFRRPAYWALILASVAAMGAFSIFVGQGISQMVDTGLSIEKAALVMSASVVIGLIAHFMAGVLSDHIDPRLLWVGGALAQGVGLVLFASSSHLLLLGVAILLLGAGGSISMLCILAVLGNWYGPRAYPAIAGVSSAMATFGGLSSLLAGYVRDHWGSYAPAYYLVGLSCVGAGVVLALLRPSRPTPRA